MMISESTLLEAVTSTDKTNLPDSAKIVESLLTYEKKARKEKTNYSFFSLTGSWNLTFITGTKKARKKAGVVLGSGKYIPKLIKIQITYQSDRSSADDTGRVINSVRLGFFNLSLTGPVKFLSPQNILAFDFTTITIKALGLQLYNGYLKNGAAKEAEFYQTAIKHQAFFRYFLIQENLIAARGRGGGLALWSRAE